MFRIVQPPQPPSDIDPDQDEHLTQILYYFANHYRPRYVRGAKEYGTKLWEFGTEWYIDQAIEENMDALAYLISAKMNILKDKDGPGNT